MANATGPRRREIELAALYETVSDLTALRDVGQVLKAIVHRSRRLVGSDAAYLMLVDEERGDAYMRVTEGTVSPDYASLRLGPGLSERMREGAENHPRRPELRAGLLT